MKNTPPIGRFKPASVLAAIAIILILVSCQNQSYGFILPPGGWNRTEAIAIIAENRDIKTTDASIDFTRYPLTVVYSDGTEVEEYFDISSQISEAKEGGTAEVTVTKDRISESFILYFYDMTVDEIVDKVLTLSTEIITDPTQLPAEDSDIFSSFCSNAHILLKDYQSTSSLAIDKYAQVGQIPMRYGGNPLYINVFDNTVFGTASAAPAEIGLSSQDDDVNNLIEISADNITVRNANITAVSVVNNSARANGAGIFGNSITISNCTLINKLGERSGKNTERTGISIEKGKTFACGPDPSIPENIRIENTSIEGFDVSVNISGYATLSNVTIDSPIVIAVDQTMLDDLNRIILTDIHSSCDGTDVYLIVPADTADARVIAFENRLKESGLTVSVESSDVEIGNVTISPWEDGGSWDGVAM